MEHFFQCYIFHEENVSLVPRPSTPPAFNCILQAIKNWRRRTSCITSYNKNFVCHFQNRVELIMHGPTSSVSIDFVYCGKYFQLHGFISDNIPTIHHWKCGTSSSDLKYIAKQPSKFPQCENVDIFASC